MGLYNNANGYHLGKLGTDHNPTGSPVSCTDHSPKFSLSSAITTDDHRETEGFPENPLTLNWFFQIVNGCACKSLPLFFHSLFLLCEELCSFWASPTKASVFLWLYFSSHTLCWLHNAQKWSFSNGIKRWTENHGHINALSFKRMFPIC